MLKILGVDKQALMKVQKYVVLKDTLIIPRIHITIQTAVEVVKFVTIIITRNGN